MEYVSPVTEEDVRNFFSRISSLIVGASVQAQEIKKLQEDFAVANERINQLQSDNAKVSKELADTWQMVQTLERERDQARAHGEALHAQIDRERAATTQVIQDYETRLSQAHDALLQRDARIAELEKALEDSKREAEDWQGKHTVLTSDHESLRASHSYWKARADDAEIARSNARHEVDVVRIKAQDLQTKLDAVQGMIEQFRSLFSPPKEEPQASLSVVA